MPAFNRYGAPTGYDQTSPFVDRTKPRGWQQAPLLFGEAPRPGEEALSRALSPTEEITQLYDQYLGRAPDAPGLAAHLQNPGGAPGYRNAIGNSPEAQQYALQQAMQPSPATGQAPPPSAPRSYTAPPGFDQAKINDPAHQSEKYQFIRYMQDHGLAPSTNSLQSFVAANPGWEMSGRDRLRGPGGGPWLDVIQGVQGSTPAWQYGYANEGPVASPPLTLGAGTATPASTDLSSVQAMIAALIQQLGLAQTR